MALTGARAYRPMTPAEASGNFRRRRLIKQPPKDLGSHEIANQMHYTSDDRFSPVCRPDSQCITGKPW